MAPVKHAPDMAADAVSKAKSKTPKAGNVPSAKVGASKPKATRSAKPAATEPAVKAVATKVPSRIPAPELKATLVSKPGPDLQAAPVVVPTISILSAGPVGTSLGSSGSDGSDDARPDGPTLKKQELVDRIVAESGAKKKDVKRILEATLSVLGRALSKGEELNLPPLGKAKVNRQREDKSGEMIIIKLKRGGKGGAAKDGKQALAEQNEDD